MKDFIKKFAREISVFGLVLVVFLGLFIYRQATYATYTTLSSTKLNVNVSTPCTFIIKKGKVTAKYPGALQYYYFKDFINANL